ncbi:MAG TPA: DUF1003 domain-containing protein [Caulobacteraceae bacterium]|jgi:uncharacterized membrane protein
MTTTDQTATPAAGGAASPPPTAHRPRRPLKNYYREKQEKLSFMNKLALWITTRVGTMGFFLIIFTWTVIWLSWNFFGPKSMRFDPPMGFVFYLFISNVIQILLMPLIMVGQNIQGSHADARAEHDLEVNIKAEQEIEVILKHLEYQNNLLINMTRSLDARLTEHIAEAGAGGGGGVDA